MFAIIFFNSWAIQKYYTKPDDVHKQTGIVSAQMMQSLLYSSSTLWAAKNLSQNQKIYVNEQMKSHVHHFLLSNGDHIMPLLFFPSKVAQE